MIKLPDDGLHIGDLQPGEEAKATYDYTTEQWTVLKRLSRPYFGIHEGAFGPQQFFNMRDADGNFQHIAGPLTLPHPTGPLFGTWLVLSLAVSMAISWTLGRYEGDIVMMFLKDLYGVLTALAVVGAWDIWRHRRWAKRVQTELWPQFVKCDEDWVAANPDEALMRLAETSGPPVLLQYGIVKHT